MIDDKNFVDLTNQLSLNQFEQIKDFVLKQGDRKTYRNFDNHNPHYRFTNFDIYFGADVGQKNSNNDPSLSDFNQLKISDTSAPIRYYELIIVRKGDLTLQKSWLKNGMQECNVYLVDVYAAGLEKLMNNLPNYLEEIMLEVNQ